MWLCHLQVSRPLHAHRSQGAPFHYPKCGEGAYKIMNSKSRWLAQWHCQAGPKSALATSARPAGAHSVRAAVSEARRRAGRCCQARRMRLVGLMCRGARSASAQRGRGMPVAPARVGNATKRDSASAPAAGPPGPAGSCRDSGPGHARLSCPFRPAKAGATPSCRPGLPRRHRTEPGTGTGRT